MDRANGAAHSGEKLDGAGIQQRAEERLIELMTQHERPLYAFIRSILSEPSSVHDCLQDIYMRAYMHLKDGGNLETAWLYRVGYNRAIDELRRRNHLAFEEVEVSSGRGDMDRHVTIEEALGYLAPLDRHVLILYACEGFKTDEIGSLLGVSGAAVRQRLYRARERVRRFYEEA